MLYGKYLLPEQNKWSEIQIMTIYKRRKLDGVSKGEVTPAEKLFIFHIRGEKKALVLQLCDTDTGHVCFTIIILATDIYSNGKKCCSLLY